MNNLHIYLFIETNGGNETTAIWTLNSRNYFTILLYFKTDSLHTIHHQMHSHSLQPNRTCNTIQYFMFHVFLITYTVYIKVINISFCIRLVSLRLIESKRISFRHIDNIIILKIHSEITHFFSLFTHRY